MKKTVIIIALHIIQLNVKAQLNCQTKTIETKQISTCLHLNKAISTEEVWTDDRFGTFKAFNNKGQQIFNTSLRKVGGHARVTVYYFTNGQVRKIEFSDAPDGGIQFYRSTTLFDENGSQTSFTKQEHDDKTTLSIPQDWFRRKDTIVKKQDENIRRQTKTPQNTTIACGAIRKSVYSVVNTTSQNIIISVSIAKGNNYLKPIHKNISVEGFQKIYIDSITLTDLSFVHNEAYTVIAQNNSSLKISKKTVEALNGQVTEYVYVITGRRKRRSNY